MINKTNPKHIPNFDLALIDSDSLMYSIAWNTVNQKMAEKALMQQVENMIETVDVNEAHVYIKGENNFRYQVDPEYKATRRASMEPEVLDRVELLYSFARKHFIESHGGEADDYVSIAAYQCLEEGRLPVICHIDKDLNMIPGWHYNFRRKEFYYVGPPESFTFMCRQLLSGDMAADNIPGLKGVGDSTAAKLLHNYRLSQMGEYIVREWKYGPREIKGINIRDPDLRYKRFLDSANCLILRETEDEICPLTEAEILRKMEWRDKETDYLFHKDRDVSDMLLLNSLPIKCQTDGRPARTKKDTVTGSTLPGTQNQKDSTQTTTADSSTE